MLLNTLLHKPLLRPLYGMIEAVRRHSDADQGLKICSYVPATSILPRMDDLQAVSVACVAVFIAVCAVRWYTDPLRAIPTVGSSSLPGLSYLGALRNLGDCRKILEEGYRKYPQSAFKISMPDQWVVVLSGREMVEELRKRPDRELSGTRGLQETFQSQYMCEPLVLLDDYHVDVVKEKLTTMLPTILPDVIDEVVVAVKDHIATRENEWTSVELMQVMQKIVARANHRAFVGLPLCRNEEYLALVVDFAVDVIKGAVALRLVPGFIKPIVALFLNKVKQDTSRAALHLQPIVEERMKNVAELGAGWNDKPNDLLQYILDRETAKSETVFVIAQRLLTLNFAAIHTSSNTITHVLYHLAEKPDLLKPLREEIQASISADGWTSAAMGKMWKLDSILRETLRYHGVGLLAMPRKAMKDITLHDGTRIPKGTRVRAAAYPLHHDDTYLEHADTFDPFRFARMRSVEGQSLKHQFTSTSSEYIGFGHGKRACPGRYFAANELKVILAYITLNYDLKLGGDGSRPPDSYIATAVVPAPHGRVLFKKRGRPSG